MRIHGLCISSEPYLRCLTQLFRYKVLDSAADVNSKIIELQALIDDHFGNETPCAAHITFLSRHLKQNVPDFAERSARASANRLKGSSKKTSFPDAAPGPE